ncbi:MAG: cadmium-translocating P-type ATPase, partial [Clostridia bacterium]|nr:cadmium-translocating P-type ATPase [Clostridia bacterium]
MKQTWRIEHLDCPNCAAKLERAVQGVPGVTTAQVDFMHMRLHVDMAEQSAAQRVIARAAEVEPEVRLLPEEKDGAQHDHDHSHDHAHDHEGGASVLMRAGAALALVIAGAALGGWIGTALQIAAYLIAGYDVLLRAARNILRGQVFDENFLMSVASVGALLMGETAEGAAVMLLYQVGEWCQGRAVKRSRASIASLMDIRPDFANVLREGVEIAVSPETVTVGETILVKPGERVPLDGVIIAGSGSLNTTALTGESLPREVAAGDEIISGCVSMTGLLTVRVTRSYGDSAVSRILALVEESGQRKAKTEQFITRFARWYTPLVCALALLLAVVPSLLTGAWSVWVHRALTFLVISCPCALVISVPLTFFAGVGGASRLGVLVKGANHMEALAAVDTVVFDKTGTLTCGTFAVTGIHPARGDAQSLLETAALAEMHSEHPIALSLKAAWDGELPLSRVTESEALPGLGVRAAVDGRQVWAGSASLMAQLGIEAAGAGVHVADEGGYLGRIDVADTLKSTTPEAIAALKWQGVKRLVMLTGDRRETAENIAAQLGLTEVHAELLPQDKVRHVEELLGAGKVAFVGDGVNDAPVLARADVVLMDDDLRRLPQGMHLAKRTVSIARQNIAFALGVKALVLLLGALGIAGMWIAVFA